MTKLSERITKLESGQVKPTAVMEKPSTSEKPQSKAGAADLGVALKQMGDLAIELQKQVKKFEAKTEKKINALKTELGELKQELSKRIDKITMPNEVADAKIDRTFNNAFLQSIFKESMAKGTTSADSNIRALEAQVFSGRRLVNDLQADQDWDIRSQLLEHNEHVSSQLQQMQDQIGLMSRVMVQNPTIPMKPQPQDSHYRSVSVVQSPIPQQRPSLIDRYDSSMKLRNYSGMKRSTNSVGAFYSKYRSPVRKQQSELAPPYSRERLPQLR